MSGGKLQPRNKRIIVCCDGTWENATDGFSSSTNKVKPATNVIRFARAVLSDGQTPQVVYYQAGVGSSDDVYDKVTGGVSGFGIDGHIRDAYAFITQNYNDGDQIIITGFSRGAFTARSIAGLIDTVGLLTKSGMDHLYRIFKDYENARIPNYKNPVKDLLNIPSDIVPIGVANVSKYQNWLRNYVDPQTGKPDPLTSQSVPKIAAIGVWDTVGSLGIPGVAWVDDLKRVLRMDMLKDDLKFFDTKLGDNVLNAFQALALDEMRYSFLPCVWEKPVAEPGSQPTNLKQVWFPGVHTNIGGGNEEKELEDITLAWMMSQIKEACGLEYDMDYVNFVFGKAQNRNYRKWACGLINAKDNPWYYELSGTHYVRTPGQYCQINDQTGNPEKAKNGALVPLRDANERVHSSVRIRLLRKEGLGINDNPAGYKCEALTPHSSDGWNGPKRHGWTIERVESDEDRRAVEHAQVDFPNEEPARFIWKSKKGKARGSDGADMLQDDGFPRYMIEDVLGEYEVMLMDMDKGVKEVWDKIPASFAK